MFNLHFLQDTAIVSCTLATALSASFVVLFIALLFIFVKNLYFHPLSKVPGPKLAAATGWYEFYYDIIRGGAYSHQYPKFHKKYASSIIRISPNHVHINDPDFYNEVFGPRSQFYKAPYFYEGTHVPGSIVTMTDPHEHKARRHVLNPLFSPRSIDGMSSRTTRTVQRALEIGISDTQAGKAINIQHLFRRIMLDSLCQTAFGQPYNSLRDEKYESELLANLDLFIDQALIGRYFPIILNLSLNLPSVIMKRIASGYMKFKAQSAGWVTDVIERRNRGIFNDETKQKYVFDLLLEPHAAKNYGVPSKEDLVHEALILVVAGTDTTSYTTAYATYYILTHSDVLKRFQDELQQALRENKGRLEWASIRQLPYLAAIVQETLRLSPPFPGSFPRVVPPQGAQFGAHFLPGGTIVSISQYIIHRDSRNFSEPETFNPDRWLGEKGKNLRKWNVAFSSGTRSCLGIHLAYQQMYITLALFFSKFEMELFDTDAGSMEWDDYGAARNKRSVKVKVKSIL